MTTFTAPVAIGDGTLLLNQYIPRTGGYFHPHATDIYIPHLPDGQDIANVLVLCPGGTATKEFFARSCGILLATPPSVQNTFWALMRAFRTAVYVPQEQACVGPGQVYAVDASGTPVLTYAPGANPYNPTDIDSRTPPDGDHPNGVFVWNDHDKLSGVDDIGFLNDASINITARFGLVGRSLCGHSEGGIMANRMWYESPLRYSHMCTASACAAAYYVANPALPSTKRPLISIVGGRDTVLHTWDGPAGAGDHFRDQYWYQDPSHHSNIDLESRRIGEWVQFQTRCAAIGDPPVAFESGVVTDLTSIGGVGTKTTWTSASGQMVLVYVALSDHGMDDLQHAMHLLCFILWMQFILAN